MPTYVRSPDIEAAPMMEETILYSEAEKQFCMLNPTAAVIWEKLAQPATLEDLASVLRDRFTVDGSADVDADVRATIDRFESLQLVRQVTGA